MLVLLSPAKMFSLDYSDFSADLSNIRTDRIFHSTTKKIVQVLKKLSVEEIAKLMKVGDKIAEQTVTQLKEFGNKKIRSTPSIAYYRGEAYKALDAMTLSASDLQYAQNHLRIFSAMYGMTRPLDAIYAYRLDMNMRFSVAGQKNLYALWRKEISEYIAEESKAHEYIVNLASDEFFSIVDTESIQIPIIQVKFLQFQNGEYKSLSVFNKQARGLLTRYIIDNQVKNFEQLCSFNYEGYALDKKEAQKEAQKEASEQICSLTFCKN